ncbi:MAG TPA: NADH:flavin oxidoreductase/NADH oxidase [Xanthobacteraceae bacterium]|jgi:NADPH2 dehydrogenase|nr:NADH:flavin oxidoreductase/NADH oxidase [Xanthobacteraceae bacterium]
MHSALFSPIRLGSVELDNRIVVSPMCQYSAVDGCATDWHIAHLGMLANSGAGLVIVEATHVERHGRITHGCLGLYSDECEAALKRVADFCRRTGTAKLGIQLAHAGRKASVQRPWEGGGPLKPDRDPWQTVGPSALPFGPGWHIPRAMEADDFARVRGAFTAAAQRAVRVGFDAIELHMAHGYLAHSFMSPLSNQRTDQYGGSIENRMRFPREITEAVRKVVPHSIALGARITGSDWLDGGLTAADAVFCAKMLKAAGLDYVDISSGGISPDARTPTKPGYNVDIAEQVRATGIATRVVGLIVTAEQAESIIAGGKADMVALARAVLDNPHWGWHAARALGADIKRPNQYLRAAPALWPGATLAG